MKSFENVNLFHIVRILLTSDTRRIITCSDLGLGT